MKVIYYVTCDSEYYSNGLTLSINRLGHSRCFNTLKEAIKEMKLAVKEAKKVFRKRIKEQENDGNTITVDVWKAVVKNEFNTETDSIWGYDAKHIVASEYICGQY